MAKIELTRPPGFRVDRGRGYRVDIDGQKAGNIRIDETKVFTLPPGRHELQLKQDWASSEKLEVVLGDNDRAQFVCAPRIKQNEESMLVGFRAVYWTTIGCRRYIDLRPGSELLLEDEPKSRWHSVDGRKLFAIALLIAIAFLALTGDGIVLVGVVVFGITTVLTGPIARGTTKVIVQITEEIQKRRGG